MADPPDTGRTRGSGAVGVAGAALAVAVLLHLPFLSTYAVRGDDWALLYHSARQFGPSVADWFTRGYADYLAVIPELDEVGTNFIRPVVNASIYLESVLVGDPQSVWFLFTNYAGHAVATALVFLIGSRIFALSTPAALLAAALFFSSSATEGLLSSVAFRGDMLGALWVFAALVVLHTYATVRPAAWRMALVLGFLTLGAFAKEAAVAGPVVAGLVLLALRSSPEPVPGLRAGVSRAALAAREHARLLGLLALPLIAYGVVRLRAGVGGTYAIDDLPNRLFGIPMAALNPFRFVLTAFVPVETRTLRLFVSEGLAALATPSGARAAVALLLNLAAWAVVGYVLARHERSTRFTLLLLAALAACSLPLLIKADPRFLYLGQGLLLPLLVSALGTLRRERAPGRAAVSATVGLLLLVGPAYFVLQTGTAQPGAVERNHEARAVQEAVVEALSAPGVRRLYLVNARDETLATLELLAQRQGRDDVEVRILNQLSGVRVADGAGVSSRVQADELVLTVDIGRDQRLFSYVTDEGLERLGRLPDLRYEPPRDVTPNPWGKLQVHDDRLTVGVRHHGRGDYAVVGPDPGARVVCLISPPLRPDGTPPCGAGAARPVAER